MPTEQNPLEYYHYYRASQRRVQQWIQNTSRELEDDTAGRSSDLRLKNGSSEEAGNGSGGGLKRRESKRTLPSSSKRQIHDSSGSRGHSSRSRSTRKKAKTDDGRVHTRSRKPHSSNRLAISSLLPLGLIPLIFVLTPPSIATFLSATILLAGYFFLDYSVCNAYMNHYYFLG